MFSLIKWGLTTCEGGFGVPKDGTLQCSSYDEGDFGKSWGRVTFEPSDPTAASAVIDELATLLTGGRLSQERRQIIESAYNNMDDASAALRLAQQLILSSPEFHSTNLAPLSGQQRGFVKENFSRKTLETRNSSYKAIVYLFLEGGADSFNLLVPHSQCDGKDMYEEYASVRKELAINKEDLLVIDDISSSQVCKKFGLHPQFSSLKDLYDAGDALFFANTGHTYKLFEHKNQRSNNDPLHSFAHNIQQDRVQRVDPFEQVVGTGVLGRIADATSSSGFAVNSFSLIDLSTALENTMGQAKRQTVVTNNGHVMPLNPRPSTRGMGYQMKSLNEATGPMSGKFAEEWSSTLLESEKETEDLIDALGAVGTTVSFPSSSFGVGLETISRLIKSRQDRGVDRDIFFILLGGFDTHSNTIKTIDNLFGIIDDGLKAFSEEMMEQNVWDDVVLVSVSDFGRTLTPNSSEGTDHAWGGNYFVVGGGLKGTRILGEYPDDLTDDGRLSDGRGRFIPSTSWDSVWHGVSKWFGIDAVVELNRVLPNYEAFSQNLFFEEDLFQ